MMLPDPPRLTLRCTNPDCPLIQAGYTGTYPAPATRELEGVTLDHDPGCPECGRLGEPTGELFYD